MLMKKNEPAAHGGDSTDAMTTTEGEERNIYSYTHTQGLRVKGNKANETTEDSEDKKREVKLNTRHKRQKKSIHPFIYPSIQFFPFQKNLQNKNWK